MLPLVLIPGMMCDGRLFSPQIGAFSAGRSVHVADISRFDSMQALAARVLRDAPPRFALAGLSMGGIVAMEVIRQAAARVARLALLDTNPLAEAPDVARRRDPQMRKANAGGLAEVMREEMKPNYLASGEDKTAILDLCMDMALSLGPDVFTRQSIALHDRPDQTETLRSYAGPTLVLCGAEDRACPVSRHTLMHDLMPGSELVIVEGAGHLPVLERPQETNEALGRWLS